MGIDVVRDAGREAGSTELLVAARWSERLGGVAVGAHDTFVGLGGSSLLLVEMLTDLREEWGIALSPADVVEHPTLGEFAAHVDRVRRERFRRRTATVLLQEGDGDVLFCLPGAGASSLASKKSSWPRASPSRLQCHAEREFVAAEAEGVEAAVTEGVRVRAGETLIAVRSA